MRKKVFITVKTYPTISYSYGELVCTAGFTEDGNFIRVYPIPFRKLENELKYIKYQWVEMDIEKNKSDFRSESYHLLNIETITMLDKVTTNNNWKERKEIIFKKNSNLYRDLKLLIDCSRKKGNECVSLAIFKPTEIIDFLIEEEKEKEWDKNKIDAIYSQYNLFSHDSFFTLVDKLPYRFYYKFKDINGLESKLYIEDWEIGALFWNCLKSHNDEKIACDLVKNKYLDIAKNKDIYLFLGTTKEFHYKSKNPFIIIGVFYPNKEEQYFLDL